MFDQTLDETRSWGAVHHVVIEGDGQFEHLPWLDPVFDECRLAGDAPYQHVQGVAVRGERPPAVPAEHANGRQANSSAPAGHPLGVVSRREPQQGTEQLGDGAG